MALGRRIWTLWRLRRYTVASLGLAVLVAVWSVASISFSPPGLRPRSLKMATATTHMVVDTPTSSVLDLRQNMYDFDAMTQRAILLGNVISNGAVREMIARRVGVPVQDLQVTAPYTRKQPRAVTGSASQKKTSDILNSTNQYRLNIQANPTVPMLDIYAQAPSASSAAVLANGAVDSLRSYLAKLGVQQRISPNHQIRLLQLGRARGTVINNGIDWQVAFVSFLLTFGLASATTIFLSRVVRGVRVAALEDQQVTTTTA